MREIAMLFALTGSTKKDGRCLFVGQVIGSLESQLRRLPSDWRSLDQPTKKELREVIANALKKLSKIADSLEKDSDNLFDALSDFVISVDEVSDKSEELSRRLPKPPSLGQIA